MLNKIISGGQTGADRAGLDIALDKGILHGGWIPKGRKTEDGTLPERYHLQEMTTTSYPKRTEKNILDSDGTIIISHGNLTGGSLLTLKLARQHNKPFIHIDLTENSITKSAEHLTRWIIANEIKTLNVAGSRASKDHEIYNKTKEVLKIAIESLIYN